MLENIFLGKTGKTSFNGKTKGPVFHRFSVTSCIISTLVAEVTKGNQVGSPCFSKGCFGIYYVFHEGRINIHHW